MNPDIPNGVPEEGTETLKSLILASSRLLKKPVPTISAWVDHTAVSGAVANGSKEALEALIQNARDQARIALNGELPLIREYRTYIAACEARIARRHLAACKKQDSIDPTILIDDDATPLSGMDIATVVMIALVSVGLLALPLLMIPNYLLSYATDNKILAISYSVLGFAGVVTLKGFYEAIPTKLGKRRFLIGLCLSSFIALGTWIGLFSVSFGGLIFEEPEQLAPSWVGQLMMIAGMIAEPLVAASGWITVTSIFQSHRPTAPNPEFQALEKDKKSLGDRLTKLQTMLARLTARHETLEASERMHVHRVVSAYEMLRKRWGFFGGGDALGGVVKPSPKPKPCLPGYMRAD